MLLSTWISKLYSDYFGTYFQNQCPISGPSTGEKKKVSVYRLAQGISVNVGIRQHQRVCDAVSSGEIRNFQKNEHIPLRPLDLSPGSKCGFVFLKTQGRIKTEYIELTRLSY